jgi:hypothetical protein
MFISCKFPVHCFSPGRFKMAPKTRLSDVSNKEGGPSGKISKPVRTNGDNVASTAENLISMQTHVEDTVAVTEMALDLLTNVDREGAKAVRLLRTVLKSHQYFGIKLQDQEKDTRGIHSAKYKHSYLVADRKTEMKRAAMLGEKVSTKSESLRRLEDTVKLAPPGVKTLLRANTRLANARLSPPIPSFPSFPSPKNSRYYTLSEAILLLTPLPKPRKIIMRWTRKKDDNGKKITPMLLCGSTCITKWLRTYKEKGILPRPDDDGVRLGRKRIVPVEDHGKLNATVLEKIGKSEGTEDMEHTLVAYMKKDFQLRGLGTVAIKPPSANTIRNYNRAAATQP